MAWTPSPSPSAMATRALSERLSSARQVSRPRPIGAKPEAAASRSGVRLRVRATVSRLEPPTGPQHPANQEETHDEEAQRRAEARFHADIRDAIEAPPKAAHQVDDR